MYFLRGTVEGVESVREFSTLYLGENIQYLNDMCNYL